MKKDKIAAQNEAGNSYFHSHGKYKDLESIFKTINAHDNREQLRGNPLRIFDKLESLYV